MKQLNQYCVALIKLKLIAYVDNSETPTMQSGHFIPSGTFKPN